LSNFAGKDILMQKRIEDFTVTRNRPLADSVFVIEAASPSDLPEIRAGQFVQVLVTGSPSTFLRRPVSVHDADYSVNTLSFLIQAVGAGTEQLSRLQPGDKLNIIYPLGNSFTLPSRGEKVLLAGGGCGMAPLLYLGRKVKETGAVPQFALGFRNRARIIEYDELSELGPVYLSTEDGSEGYKGFVTDIPEFRDGKWDRVYCCGPEPMMKAVAEICRVRDIFCEVSLENLMACGLGICLCCIVPTTSGNLCSCTDGPVFNIRDLKWLT
jgi:dihydroorotate dehydrogenase electron transfer subunit